MTENQHEGLPINRPELQKLFVNWLIQLLDERFGVKQRGSSGTGRWNITLTDESFIEAEFDTSGPPRVQGAIFAYEQAMRQDSEYVTIALLVSALEALSVPNASWQQERVTTRFFRFVQELCSDSLVEIMAHGNFAQAFGAYGSQRRFIDAMYSLRSKPLHTGFVQHRLSALPGMHGDAGIRVTLVSMLVCAGINEFLRRPFSSLTGHPQIAPAAQTQP